MINPLPTRIGTKSQGFGSVLLFVRSRVLDSARAKRELLIYAGCLMTFWVIGAAAASGLALTALFLVVAVTEGARNLTHWLLTRSTSKRALIARYVTGLMSLTFFGLLVGRACYIAAVLVDTAFRDGETVGLVARISNPLQ